MCQAIYKRKIIKGRNNGIPTRKSRCYGVESKMKDKKNAVLLSIIQNPQMTEIELTWNTVTKCLKVVNGYNSSMGGVNTVNQHVTSKKRGKTYNYKMLLHFLDQTRWNSFVLFGKHKTSLHSRLDPVPQIIDIYDKSAQSFGRPSESSLPLKMQIAKFGRRQDDYCNATRF